MTVDVCDNNILKIKYSCSSFFLFSESLQCGTHQMMSLV